LNWNAGKQLWAALRTVTSAINSKNNTGDKF